MGNFGNRKDSPGFWLSFFLLLGAAAGTLFCNWPDSGWKEALRDAGSGLVLAAVLGAAAESFVNPWITAWITG